LIGQAQRQAGRPGCPVARHLSACVANADLPEEEQALASALRAQGWSSTTEVVNDTFAVLRAGLDASVPAAPSVPADSSVPVASSVPAGPSAAARCPAERHARAGAPAARDWGVPVPAGAGVNSVGVAAGGGKTGVLVLAGVTGDGGGGHGLGQAALWWGMRGEGGRGPDTVLRGDVAAPFGVR